MLIGGEKWRGVAVEPGGEAEIGHASFAGCAGMVTSSGRLLMDSVDGKGDSGDGVVLSGGTFELSDVDLTGWAQSVVVIGGEGVLAKSTLTGNEVGVVYKAGELELAYNSIHGNERNIQADRQLAVRDNFLGAAKAEEARVSEKVILKSVLDAPHPDGRVIALMEDEDLTAAQVTKRFEEHKARGVELFNGRKYGDAYAELSKAVRYKADRDTYLYLAYTQMELGEADRAGKTLESGIEAFPYDYRLHQLYVRHLIAQGNDGRAMSVVDAALKFDPGNANLQFLKEYIVEEVKKMRSVTSEGSR